MKSIKRLVVLVELDTAALPSHVGHFLLAFCQRPYTRTADFRVNPTRRRVPRGLAHLAAVRAVVHDLHPVTEQEAGVVAPASGVFVFFKLMDDPRWRCHGH